MKLHVIIILFTVFIFQLSCIGVAHNKKLVKKYYLSAFDTNDDMELQVIDSNGYAFAIISETVFSVGFNNSYIIAKQHPRVFGEKENKAIVNYYIVPIRNKPSSYEHHPLLGPFTATEFKVKMNELKIDLNFSKTFKSLE